MKTRIWLLKQENSSARWFSDLAQGLNKNLKSLRKGLIGIEIFRFTGKIDRNFELLQIKMRGESAAPGYPWHSFRLDPGSRDTAHCSTDWRKWRCRCCRGTTADWNQLHSLLEEPDSWRLHLKRETNKYKDQEENGNECASCKGQRKAHQNSSRAQKETCRPRGQLLEHCFLTCRRGWSILSVSPSGQQSDSVLLDRRVILVDPVQFYGCS